MMEEGEGGIEGLEEVWEGGEGKIEGHGERGSEGGRGRREKRVGMYVLGTIMELQIHYPIRSM